jgi:hypothetical protein
VAGCPFRLCLAWVGVTGDPCTVPSAFILFPQGSWRMAEAPELPAEPLASFAGRAGMVQPDPARSRRPRVGVVLAAGRSERLASVTGGGSKALLRLGGLSLVERAVRSLLAAGLDRVLVVVGHDAGPVATVVGRFGRGRIRAVYADRWADGNGASRPQSRMRSRVRRCSCWSPRITSSVRAGWMGCWWPVSRPCSSILPPTGRRGRRGPGSGWWRGPWSPSASTWRSRPSTAAPSCCPLRCSAVSTRRPPRAITPWPVP